MRGMAAILQNEPLWDDVRVFLALWRGRTLTAAATSLKVNPSTIGRRIDALETAIGARLFDRSPDGVSPTPAGEQLLMHAERVEAAMHGLVGGTPKPSSPSPGD